jgi:uncharacterized protein (TIGR02145 family)
VKTEIRKVVRKQDFLKLTLLTVGLGIYTLTFSQIPEEFSYQAVVRNIEKAPVAGTPLGVKIEIIKGAETGTIVYDEVHHPVTDQNGLFSIVVGRGSPRAGSIDSLDWSDDIFFIRSSIDPEGGANYSIQISTQLLSVPYALYAKRAARFDGNMGHKRITNLGIPQNTADAVSVEYLRNILSQINVIPNNFSGTVTDVEGNIYKTIRVGSQEWMAENLKTTRYNDGSLIPLVREADDWDDLSTPAYCWYNNDRFTYNKTYGVLYNGYAAQSGNICPTGWHVPSTEEIRTLWENFETDNRLAGGSLKEGGTTRWNSPNRGASNSSGFTALPGGSRNSSGEYQDTDIFGFWWTTSTTGIYFNFYQLSYINPQVSTSYSDGRYGLSIRCVKD